MHVTLKRQIFCHSQCYLWCDQTLYDRVICQVQEHTHMVGYSVLIKCLAEEICHVMLNSHSSKHNCEIFIRITAQRGLFYNLRC